MPTDFLVNPPDIAPKNHWNLGPVVFGYLEAII